jgi:uncharacterized protein with FMN-binding domain
MVIQKSAAIFAAAALITAAVLNCAGLAPGASPRYKSGVYEGRGQGFRGPVRVAVRLDREGITGIAILDHADDEIPGGAAMEELLELVLDAGSADVDVIAGATESAAGFLSAVEDALRRARSQAP